MTVEGEITTQDAQAFFKPPQQFSPKGHVVCVFLQYHDRFLFLKKAQGYQLGKWGLPGGKVQKWESLICAMQRELIEETGIFVQVSDLSQLGQVYMRNHWDYLLTVFHCLVTTPKEPFLSKEHGDSQWCSISQALDLPLLIGQHQILCHFMDAKLIEF